MARRIRMEAITQAWLDAAPKVARDPSHPAWMGVGKLGWEALEGKAVQPVDAKVEVGITVTQGLGLRRAE